MKYLLIILLFFIGCSAKTLDTFNAKVISINDYQALIEFNLENEIKRQWIRNDKFVIIGDVVEVEHYEYGGSPYNWKITKILHKNTKVEKEK